MRISPFLGAFVMSAFLGCGGGECPGDNIGDVGIIKDYMQWHAIGTTNLIEISDDDIFRQNDLSWDFAKEACEMPLKYDVINYERKGNRITGTWRIGCDPAPGVVIESAGSLNMEFPFKIKQRNCKWKWDK